MSSQNGANFSVVRMPNGQFVPGSGGRPKGSKNRVSSAAMRGVKEMAEQAIEQLRSKLMAGDWAATVFVLEKVLPRGRVVELDGVTPEDIISHMIQGEISAIEAKEITTAIKNLADISELKEINNRLKLLEAMLTGDVR